MGRPFKKGLDYFPLDVVFDTKTEVFEAEQGLLGFAVLVKLWQKIYSEGYYLKWDADTELLFSKQINAEVNQVNSVVNSCLSRGILDKSIFETYGYLTSKAIQSRYFNACKCTKRKNIEIIEPFLLVKPEDFGLTPELISLNPEEFMKTLPESTQKKRKERDSEKKRKERDSETELAPDFSLEVINYLNNKTGSKYKNIETNKKHILARVKEGATLEDFKTVIDKKVKTWTGTEWEKFLRPMTLFGAKFDSYLNEKVHERKTDVGRLQELLEAEDD